MIQQIPTQSRVGITVFPSVINGYIVLRVFHLVSFHAAFCVMKLQTEKIRENHGKVKPPRVNVHRLVSNEEKPYAGQISSQAYDSVPLYRLNLYHCIFKIHRHLRHNTTKRCDTRRYWKFSGYQALFLYHRLHN